MSAVVSYMFRRVASLSSLAIERGIDVLIAGDAYASWEEAVKRQHRFIACIDRRSEAKDGMRIRAGATRFVLFLQYGWRPNILVDHTCGSSTSPGTVEQTIATYLDTLRRDPRKLIARHFRGGAATATVRNRPMPVYMIMGIEAADSILLPAIRGPYLLWP